MEELLDELDEDLPELEELDDELEELELDELDEVFPELDELELELEELPVSLGPEQAARAMLTSPTPNSDRAPEGCVNSFMLHALCIFLVISTCAMQSN